VLVESSQTTNYRTFKLPLNNCGVMALDYLGKEGCDSIGHSPVAALIDPVAGRELAIAEAFQILFGHLSKMV
jgi:phosphoribosylformylglycinamidine synthase